MAPPVTNSGQTSSSEPAYPSHESHGPRGFEEIPRADAMGRVALDVLASTMRVVVLWGFALLVEAVVTAIGHKSHFAGSWETTLLRGYVVPLATCQWALGAPGAVLLGRLARAAAHDRWARSSLAFLGGVFGALTAWGVSTGRHFEAWPVRLGFVISVGLVGVVVTAFGGPVMARQCRCRPELAWGAPLVAVLLWAGDLMVLPRLYPSFHDALAVLAFLSLAVAAEGLVRFTKPLAVVFAGLVFFCSVRVPKAVQGLWGSDNLRNLLVDYAPWLGRSVRWTMAAWPPPDALEMADGSPSKDSSTADMDSAAEDTGRSDLVGTDVGRPAPKSRPALDWTNRDIVLLSVDALRADHLGVYGYARRTSPEMDALAKEGTVFTSAYCPTPHTSYSVTSMMTGKYMKPLLALGRGEDSETWALLLRRYGYRTAALYPPAVFFIDENRFQSFRDRFLDFEYRKVEFADPSLRLAQMDAYLRTVDRSQRLFLWVHYFEPHEPYEMHAEYNFVAAGAEARAVDAYDSEVAAADAGIGALVRRIRQERPEAVILVTADHGEEFGDHGGRYHGTTVYEEQVRVPLVVVGPGVRAQRVDEPVQTIDLLPTVLGALGIPKPPRIRGRDLGSLLASGPSRTQAQEGLSEASAPAAPKGATGIPAGGPLAGLGLAFAETDDAALVAQGPWRLICRRRAAACSLFDTRTDPQEQHDVGANEGEILRTMRQRATGIARDHGRFEPAAEGEWPDVLRRGILGDVAVAEDVAALLEDANVRIRRKAAEVSFALHQPATVPALKRALGRLDDEVTERFCALALLRAGGGTSAKAEALLSHEEAPWRQRSALAFAERGDGRGAAELVAWWTREAPPGGKLDFVQAQEILGALVQVRGEARGAAPALARSLEDVRLRPHVAQALGALGDASVRPALLSALRTERYLPVRDDEVRALLALGAKEELRPALERFVGVPEPLEHGLEYAAAAGLLTPARGGHRSGTPTEKLDVSISLPRAREGRGLRLLVELVDASGRLDLQVDEGAVVPSEFAGFSRRGRLLFLDWPSDGRGARGRVRLQATVPIRSFWVVAKAEELPPPPKEAWTPSPNLENSGSP